MSEGKLCNATIEISGELNSENTIEVSCDLYEGHEGAHSTMYYHCKKREDNSGIIDNFRLGRINWKDKIQNY